MTLAGEDPLYLEVLEVTHDYGTALQLGKRQQTLLEVEVESDFQRILQKEPLPYHQ